MFPRGEIFSAERGNCDESEAATRLFPFKLFSKFPAAPSYRKQLHGSHLTIFKTENHRNHKPLAARTTQSSGNLLFS